MSSIPWQKLDRRMTLAEYVAFEEAAETRHEFIGDTPYVVGDASHVVGEVFAMAGTTYEHVKVSKNLNGMLYNRLRGSRCENLGNDLRISWKRGARYFYPEMSIVCGKPEFAQDLGDKKLTLLNATALFEVFSESSEAYDRGEKFTEYRRIESLREYILLRQDRAEVQTFFRHDDGGWMMRHYAGLDAVAKLASVGIDLPLAELYAGVHLLPEPAGDDATVDA